MAVVLEIDTLMYCNIERGSRSIKRAQVVALAKFLSAHETELLTLWLADKVLAVLKDENELTGKVLEMLGVKSNTLRYGRFNKIYITAK